MALTTFQKDHLQCKGKLGQGSFGDVYKAHHTQLGDFAVKVYHKSMKEDAVKLVQREIVRMVKVVMNDYVVQIRGTIDNVSHYCIVMEFMEYGSLKTFQRRLTSFPPALKVRMISDVILGMNFLHTLPEPIIHRDLKLENIFVGRGFTAKVGDLGLATWCAASDYKYRAGTISHIAPEILADINKGVTTKSDMYSFGITLWEFVTSGRQPYENAANDKHIERNVEKGERPNTNPDIISPKYEPNILVEMMKRAWHQEPDKRPTFQEMKDWIGDEYKSKYEKDIGLSYKDVALSYSELSKQLQGQEELVKECKFPWEEGSQPIARAEDITMETKKPFVDKYPAKGTLPGVRKITAGMAAIGISTQLQGASTEIVTQDDIYLVYENIGTLWKRLGRKLQVRDTDIQIIDHDEHGQHEKAIRVIWMWKNGSYNPTKGELAQALDAVGLKEVAQMLL